MNKKLIIITTLLIFLPTFIGIAMYDQFPAVMATHFNIHGVPDGYSSRFFTVIGIPAIVAAIHLLAIFFTRTDPKNKNSNPKIINLVIWICPLVCLLVESMIFSYALDNHIDIIQFTFIFTSLLFMVIGNYLPKTRQNYTIGIRIPWTLNDEDNWYATHRFAGKLWTICGIIMLIECFLKIWLFPVMTIIFCIMTIVPIIYSYLYSKRFKESM